ncbi:hypothetical protein JCM11641_007272 [Rhodosporidiobolus odoratus]
MAGQAAEIQRLREENPRLLLERDNAQDQRMIEAYVAADEHKEKNRQFKPKISSTVDETDIVDGSSFHITNFPRAPLSIPSDIVDLAGKANYLVPLCLLTNEAIYCYKRSLRSSFDPTGREASYKTVIKKNKEDREPLDKCIPYYEIWPAMQHAMRLVVEVLVPDSEKEDVMTDFVEFMMDIRARCTSEHFYKLYRDYALLHMNTFRRGIKDRKGWKQNRLSPFDSDVFEQVASSYGTQGTGAEALFYSRTTGAGQAIWRSMIRQVTEKEKATTFVRALVAEQEAISRRIFEHKEPQGRPPASINYKFNYLSLPNPALNPPIIPPAGPCGTGRGNRPPFINTHTGYYNPALGGGSQGSAAGTPRRFLMGRRQSELAASGKMCRQTTPTTTATAQSFPRLVTLPKSTPPPSEASPSALASAVACANTAPPAPTVAASTSARFAEPEDMLPPAAHPTPNEERNRKASEAIVTTLNISKFEHYFALYGMNEMQEFNGKRLIENTSYPKYHKENAKPSINSSIAVKDYECTFHKFEEVAAFRRTAVADTNTRVGGADIKKVFHHIPLAPSVRLLLCLWWSSLVHPDSSALRHQVRSSRCYPAHVRFALTVEKKFGGKVKIIPHIDDLCIAIYDPGTCLEVVLNFLRDLGWVLEDKKKQELARRTMHVGVEWDLDRLLAIVPKPKKIKYRLKIADILSTYEMTKVPKKRWESLVGSLQYVATIIPRLRPKLRILYNFTSAYTSAWAGQSIEEREQRALEEWSKILGTEEGLSSSIANPPKLFPHNITSDTSMKALGIYICTVWTGEGGPIIFTKPIPLLPGWEKSFSSDTGNYAAEA